MLAQRPARYIALLFVFAVLISAVSADARETKTANSETSAKADSEIEQEGTSGLVVNGKSYDVGGAIKMPSTGQMKTHLCKRDPQQSPFCDDWKNVAKSYESVAKNLGLPAAFLMCVTKQESRFGRNTGVSPAGASGANQFMPNTAAEIAGLIFKQPYKSAYASYAMETGCNLPVSSANIRSRDYPSHYCLSNFALGVHMRRDMAAIEDQAEAKLGSTSAPSQPMMENILKYLIVSYNGGPGNGLRFKNNGFSTAGSKKKRGISGETRKYIRNVLDGCLKPASSLPES